MFSLKELISITSGEPVNIKDSLKITGISTDSRDIGKGEVFIALIGESFDGHNFIGNAKERGAIAAIVMKDFRPAKDYAIIKVEDTRTALSNIARAHRNRFDIPIIGISGSNGKTTTKDMIAHILGRAFNVLKTEKNCNNQIGVAKTLLRLKDQDLAVVEVGTSFFGEIRSNCEVVKPTIALITNIGYSHLEGLKSREGVLKEKIAIVESLKKGATWVKNVDDDMLADKEYKDIKTISYGIDNDKSDFRAQEIKQTASATEFTLKVRDGFAGKISNTLIRLPLLGLHNVYNALAAIAISSIFIDIKVIAHALCDFESICMRTEILDGGGFTIINDCYNSNPASFRYGIACLRDYPALGKRIAVVGDMLDLGEESEKLHYESGKFLAETKGIDFLVTFGERSLDIARGALDQGMNKERVVSFKDKDKIEPFLRTIINAGDALLVKGSRGMEMEEITKCFITCSTR